MVAPVFRDLPVTVAGRSVAFYRDVLGFEVSKPTNGAAAEVTNGPVRLRFVERGGKDGAHTVFFETDDVRGMREAIAARGGKPGEVDRVNWIRMHAFELRDPDGHALWFGQSLHTPLREIHTPQGIGQLRQIIPSMPHRDVARGIAHYRDVLGFTINFAQENLGVMDRDSVRVLIVKRDDRGVGGCYVYVRDIDQLHAELVAKGANVQETPVSHPWGLRDFSVRDDEGNEITFGQTFE